MNIQGLKQRCEMQQRIIQSWKKAYERQEKLLRRALFALNYDEYPKLMKDILREINADCIE